MKITRYIPIPVREAIRESYPYRMYLRRRYLKPFPGSMNIELTNQCNLKCSFCPHSKIRMKKKEIDYAIFKKFVDDLDALRGITELVPVGLGEPFLYSRWEEAFRYCKLRQPNTPFRIVTNGVAMDEKTAKTICSIFTAQDSILISINAWERETYKKMMNSDQFERVVENVESLIESRKRTGAEFAIKTQIIKTVDTKDQIKDFQRFWSKRLTNSQDMALYLRELENWGGKIETNNKTLKTTKERYPCLSLWTVVVVDSDGNAYPCCESLADRENSNLLLGNIMDSSVLELYSCETYHGIQELHLTGRWDEIPECVNCDFWSSAKNVWHKRITKNGDVRWL